MSRRKLRPEEVELWRKVADTAHRLHPDRPSAANPKPKPKPEKTLQMRLPEFAPPARTSGSATAYDLAPTPAEGLARAPLKMDKKTFGKLKRGKMTPEGKLDLHGMTLDRAHPALAGFILRAHGQGKRLVLVVTGKGKSGHDHGPIPRRIGVLRHQVPQWLSLSPLRDVVLQVSEAHGSHGGGGAYYVYLKRQR